MVSLFPSVAIPSLRQMQFLLFFACALPAFCSAAPNAAPDPTAMRQWVEAMKEAPRGPFSRIRWFCQDGTILEPLPFACKNHGGGVQHGEWSETTRTLRAQGYFIANIFADLDPEAFLARQEAEQIIKQMIVEQFLILADDGWIFRKALFYKGALQAEGEAKKGGQLLQAMSKKLAWQNDLYPVLMESFRLLPHRGNDTLFTEVRQLALSLTENDPGFERIRTKIHVRPGPEDAALVRAHSRDLPTERRQSYERLAARIELLHQSPDPTTLIAQLSRRTRDQASVQTLHTVLAGISQTNAATHRFAAACGLLAFIRDSVSGGSRDSGLLLELALQLEREIHSLTQEIDKQLDGFSRQDRLALLTDTASALYGLGLLSSRQDAALRSEARETGEAQTLEARRYKQSLEYLGRCSFWARRTLLFHFQESIDSLAAIEPLSRRYIDDRLHASPLAFYAAVLDSLSSDAAALLGLKHLFLGESVVSGVRALNPGIGRGVLHILKAEAANEPLDKNGIYLLPATTANLPAVAGILTTGYGNTLSHVQLLARSLGIPNVAVEERLVARLEQYSGRQVVLAVSPGGVVQLDWDGPAWDSFFAAETDKSAPRLEPESDKLALEERDLISLSAIRAADSGRIAGPKAANLGELKHRFPEAVADGLVIPFGVFHALLEQPFTHSGPTIFQWLQSQYAALRTMQDDERYHQQVQKFLAEAHARIAGIDPGPEFRARLRLALSEIFGPEGSYGLFVRSDTNVEDLPGFSGAGLNLTVANVVGFDPLVAAISNVWASPFTTRAFQWRQMRMARPEDLFVSVLLMKSVPVEKSGVMVTADIDTGSRKYLTVAVNEGVGGAVAGQSAEELRIPLPDGPVTLLAQASDPWKLVLPDSGGVIKVRAAGLSSLLNQEEITALRQFAEKLPGRFPAIQDQRGEPAPADVEFGFRNSTLSLFQIRPFVNSDQARRSELLRNLDNAFLLHGAKQVRLRDRPETEGESWKN